MVVLRYASSGLGELCVVMGGTTMMPELCVDNSDMTLKVCTVLYVSLHLTARDYLHAVAVISCRNHQLYTCEVGAAFLSGLRCTGLENVLTMCPARGTRDDRCGSAGVACGKRTSKSTVRLSIAIMLAYYSTDLGRCKNESVSPMYTQNTVTDLR